MTEQAEPITIADALPARLRERLEAMGVQTAAELAKAADAEPRTESPEDRQERLERRRNAYRARWEAQVPPMYADASWSDLDEAQRFDWPQESLNLVLAGPVGTGKTHAAYALGNAFSARGQWVQATTVVDLLAAMRPDGDASLARAAQSCHVLILDDLGAGKASEFAVEQMTALMDLRIREGRRTIMTTNVPEPDLEAAWGGRFADRLRYRRTVAVFKGESRRKAAW